MDKNRKKWNRVLLALLLSLAFNVAFIAAVGYHEFIGRKSCDMMPGMRNMTHANLSAEQQKRFDENKKRLEAQLTPLRMQMALHCRNLSKILATPSPTPESIHDETAALADIQRRVQNLILNNYLKNRASLTEEQRKYYDGRLRENLCSAGRCGAGGSNAECPMDNSR